MSLKQVLPILSPLEPGEAGGTGNGGAAGDGGAAGGELVYFCHNLG